MSPPGLVGAKFRIPGAKLKKKTCMYAFIYMNGEVSSEK